MASENLEIDASLLLKLSWEVIKNSIAIAIFNVILALIVQALGYNMMATLIGVAIFSITGVAILLPPMYLIHASLSYLLNEVDGLNPLGYIVFGLVSMAILALPILATLTGSAVLGLELSQAFLNAVVLYNAPYFLWNTGTTVVAFIDEQLATMKSS